MKIKIDRFSVIYPAICLFFGMIAYTINQWFGITIFAAVAMLVFHEPVHVAAAKILKVHTEDFVLNKSGSYISVPEDSRKTRYVALAGFLFDLGISAIMYFALNMNGLWVAGLLWIAFVIIVSAAHRQSDLRTFYRLTDTKP